MNARIQKLALALYRSEDARLKVLFLRGIGRDIIEFMKPFGRAAFLPWVHKFPPQVLQR